MKKLCLAVSILAASTSAAWAQSSVTIYGILDGAVRYTTNSGPTAATKAASLSQMVGGGMSQSRLGVNVVEDLGDGLKALASMEHRLLLDTGTSAGADFWRQAWVGLQSNNFGRITLGRQYNLLFDAATSTYASFKYSPYIEVFKPEIGMAITARQSNMVKYLVESGGLRFEAQVSAGENGGDAATIGQGKSMGGMARYAVGSFAGAYVWLQSEDKSGKKVTAQTLGASWTDGPLYVNVAWAQNKFETGFDPAVNAGLLGTVYTAIGTRTAVATGAAAKVRDLYSAGVTYQLTPQLNVGAQVWKGKQTGLASGADGVIDAMAFVADYALSKRTDAYVEFDNFRAKGNLTLANTALTRTGYMVGLRHRF
ncbi:porin [Pelomonas sp. SE-A7]|uniref:porin n=1 Tax=Pelomonas sp. SE-A7 TaxID=3054953 RepID=UPI00259D3109|nr:porin [Pelomonas sp. SE-A7]MDM4767737.1 porin [Pelomonas sp. SE-A7]